MRALNTDTGRKLQFLEETHDSVHESFIIHNLHVYFTIYDCGLYTLSFGADARGRHSKLENSKFHHYLHCRSHLGRPGGWDAASLIFVMMVCECYHLNTAARCFLPHMCLFVRVCM